MIEELSLPHNRGSRLFQQRQRRMQRFTFENLSSHREVGLRLSPSSNRDSPFPAGKRFPVRSGVSQPCSYIEMKGEEGWLGGVGMEMGKAQHPPKSKGMAPFPLCITNPPPHLLQLPGPGGSHRTERGDREGAANEWTVSW